MVSWPSVITFTYCLTVYSYVPLKLPFYRKIHHWWILFTIFSSFWTNLIYSGTSILSILRYASTTIFSRCKYWIRTEKNAPTTFHWFEFLNKSFTCINSICLYCQSSHQHQTIYLELQRIHSRSYVQLLHTSKGTKGGNQRHVVTCSYQVILKLHRVWFNIWIQSIRLNSASPPPYKFGKDFCWCRGQQH